MTPEQRRQLLRKLYDDARDKPEAQAAMLLLENAGEILNERKKGIDVLVSNKLLTRGPITPPKCATNIIKFSPYPPPRLLLYLSRPHRYLIYQSNHLLGASTSLLPSRSTTLVTMPWEATATSEQVVAAYALQVEDRTFVITGAGQPLIGSSMATELAKASPAHMLIASRTAAKVDPVLFTIRSINPSIKATLVQLDLSNHTSVRKAASDILAATGSKST